MLISTSTTCHVVTILNGFLSRILYIFFIILPLSWAIYPTGVYSTPPVLENSYRDTFHTLLPIHMDVVFLTLLLMACRGWPETFTSYPHMTRCSAYSKAEGNGTFLSVALLSNQEKIVMMKIKCLHMSFCALGSITDVHIG